MLIGGRGCDAKAPGDVAFLKEDARRSVSTLDAGHAADVPRYQASSETAGTLLDREPRYPSTFGKRPLVTTLRI
jgi:hypothetical protein